MSYRKDIKDVILTALFVNGGMSFQELNDELFYGFVDELRLKAVLAQMSSVDKTIFLYTQVDAFYLTTNGIKRVYELKDENRLAIR